MRERVGVVIGLLSCGLGAGAAVATRHLIGEGDAVTLAAIRFGGGALCVLPLALLLRARWPAREDRAAVAVLGFLFYGVFFGFYNLALQFTTVARGTLALSTLPLMTMLVGSLLGLERMSLRKSAGVLLAVGGVLAALVSGAAGAPAGAWRGDAIMALATLCMALYSVYSRPYVSRSSPLGVLALGMAVGGLAMAAASVASGGAASLVRFGPGDWLAATYLAAGGGALAFILWIYALQLASPTQVTNTMTANPLVATLLAAGLLDEPVPPSVMVGLVVVFAGLWVSTIGAPDAPEAVATRSPRRRSGHGAGRKSRRPGPW